MPEENMNDTQDKILSAHWMYEIPFPDKNYKCELLLIKTSLMSYYFTLKLTRIGHNPSTPCYKIHKDFTCKIDGEVLALSWLSGSYMPGLFGAYASIPYAVYLCLPKEAEIYARSFMHMLKEAVLMDKTIAFDFYYMNDMLVQPLSVEIPADTKKSWHGVFADTFNVNSQKFICDENQ